MKKILSSIINLFKGVFGHDIKMSYEKNQKYNINKNKQCNISINDVGGNIDKK